jgi:hypothetical protein
MIDTSSKVESKPLFVEDLAEKLEALTIQEPKIEEASDLDKPFSAQLNK